MEGFWQAYWLFHYGGAYGSCQFSVMELMPSSLPGAIGMFGFSLGVSRIGETLPGAVFALLSGLNAATVGIIALAAVQLSQKVITDQLTRSIVFLGGTAGMLYTALWYFPVLMVAAGLATVLWDLRLVQKLGRLLRPRAPQVPSPSELEDDRRTSNTVDGVRASGDAATTSSQRDTSSTVGSGGMRYTRPNSTRSNDLPTQGLNLGSTPVATASPEQQHNIISWKLGTVLLVLFFASFLSVMLVRSLSPVRPRVFSIFANLYLAGTIIFGGGPVVIPLLREYVVAQGWVSPRDFLLGLALIQAFPGPNFNFAVYLGALAVAGTGVSPILGALVAFLGIFVPGLVVQSGFMGLWTKVRRNRAMLSALRGVNAAAVGLIFTAVYRLWQIGFLDQENQDGQPLGGSPWWVVVTATSFVGGSWYALSPPMAVVLGGVMGLIWYGVTQS